MNKMLNSTTQDSNTKEQKQDKSSSLIPPRMPKKFESILKPCYQTEGAEPRMAKQREWSSDLVLT